MCEFVQQRGGGIPQYGPGGIIPTSKLDDRLQSGIPRHGSQKRWAAQWPIERIPITLRVGTDLVVGGGAMLELVEYGENLWRLSAWIDARAYARQRRRDLRLVGAARAVKPEDGLC